MKKLQLFDQNHGLYPLQKCQFCGFLKPMFLLFSKGCLLYKTSKNVFSRFIFTIYDMGIPGVTKGYKGLQGVTSGYKGLEGVTRGDRGLQGVTRGYSGLQRVTRGYRGLQGVTGSHKALQRIRKDYRNFFLTRRFPDTFSWYILHKNPS